MRIVFDKMNLRFILRINEDGTGLIFYNGAIFEINTISVIVLVLIQEGMLLERIIEDICDKYGLDCNALKKDIIALFRDVGFVDTEEKKEEKKDFFKCKKCGGECCKIYSNWFNNSQNLNQELYFQDWIDSFHIGRDNYGVKPHFNLNELFNNAEKNSYKDYLDRSGYKYCEYLGESGCLIEWEKRPTQCKTYICKDWDML